MNAIKSITRMYIRMPQHVAKMQIIYSHELHFIFTNIPNALFHNMKFLPQCKNETAAVKFKMIVPLSIASSELLPRSTD